MYRHGIHKISLLILALLFVMPASAAETIGWDGLVPPIDESRDPYARLSEPQQDALYDLWMVRERRAAGSTNPDLDNIRAEAVTELEAGGFNADEILSDLDAFLATLEANKSQVVDSLDGKRIRIPGYVLPTEFVNDKIVEFLLVPYVGACVHTPAPPANQMVYVSVDDGFTSTGLFQPVWVSGKINTELTTQAVDLSDGSLDVEAGYQISSADVVPYE